MLSHLTPGRRTSGLGTAVLLFTLMATGVAFASRRSNTRELRAMVFTASGRYYGGLNVDEPRGTPLACFAGDISTVRKGSRWGAWSWSAYGDQPANAQRCQTANGISIEHKIKGRWYVLWEGSEGYPPTHTTRVGSLILQGVPRAVAKDLIRGLS